MQGSLIKFHILFHCLLDGGQFSLSAASFVSSVDVTGSRSQMMSAKRDSTAPN